MYSMFICSNDSCLRAFSRHRGFNTSFMISGALFLDENKNYDYPKMKKHVLNILLVLISWSFIYVISLDFVLYKVSKVPLLPFIDIFRNFIQGYDILWFLK